jgi:hypothetical protein
MFTPCIAFTTCFKSGVDDAIISVLVRACSELIFPASITAPFFTSKVELLFIAALPDLS